MPHHANGYDWFWMVPMMVVWVLVLVGAIYVAVRLGNEHSRRRR